MKGMVPGGSAFIDSFVTRVGKIIEQQNEELRELRELRDNLREGVIEEGEIEMKMCSECYHIAPNCLSIDRGEHLSECVFCEKQLCEECGIFDQVDEEDDCLNCGKNNCLCVSTTNEFN